MQSRRMGTRPAGLDPGTRDVLEGTLRLRLDDGRELSALVFGAKHAARVLARWAAGDCGEDYQAASGGHYPCAGRAGHPGRCGHRAEDTERTEHGDALAACHGFPEPVETIEGTLIAEDAAERAARDATLRLFEPTSEVKFGDLLELAREVSGVTVEPFEDKSSALVTIESTTAPARVWDNGGEVGVRSLANWNLPDMFPIRLCSGLLDPWEVWRAVRDSIERQGRGENGRGGDAPFPLLPEDPAVPPAGEPCIDCESTRTIAGTCLDCAGGAFRPTSVRACLVVVDKGAS